MYIQSKEWYKSKVYVDIDSNTINIKIHKQISIIQTENRGINKRGKG